MIPAPVRVANEALAFLLELVTLGLLAWWGFTLGHSLPLHLLLGLGLPLLAAVVWGRYAAPRATVRLPMPAVLGVKAVVFAAGAAALGARTGPGWGLGFALLCLANTALATRYRSALAAARAERP
ncbi:DUF2568 domain-containing protein [Kitasatospora sp. NPDC058965]|uniref:DUF2568 domain-containing protein n=1 Tax=Kitasatospora sp. NPDC058965 TaxID=3346682 RepID=UPI00368EEA8D